jgi:hypothetical protein
MNVKEEEVKQRKRRKRKMKYREKRITGNSKGGEKSR